MHARDCPPDLGIVPNDTARDGRGQACEQGGTAPKLHRLAWFGATAALDSWVGIF
jgi:hypothetical protein